MPTNLPAEARAKWVKYLDARTPEEKLKALEEYLSAIPKHKGTENLRAWVRRKIAELREEIEERKARKAGGGGLSFFIEKEGAAQLVMLGMPNSGKSALLSVLTNAKPEISDIPFTTKFPVPGMLRFEDVQFQIIEAPALIEGASAGSIWWGSRVLGLARNADAVILVIDLTQKPFKQLKTLVNELMRAGIYIVKPRGRAVIERSKAVHGIKLVSYGRLIGCTEDDVRKLLQSYRIYNATVKIYGEVRLSDIERAIFERITYKPTLILLNKADAIGLERAELLRRRLDVALRHRVPIIVTSAVTRYGIDSIPRQVFRVSRIIRVYTKEPNSQQPSSEPMILKKGSTVEDAVKRIREDFLKYFKYARIWGPSAKFPGERVGLDHVLADKDIIEVRTRIKGI